MKTPFLTLLFAFLISALTFSACKKEKDETQEETTTNSTTDSTNASTGSNGSGNTDTTVTVGGSGTGTTKPSATSIRFAANGKDCGITDGYANQQHTLPSLVHLNLDKTILPGTYTVTTSSTVPANQVNITSAKYNWTDWTATSGSVVVTTNATDTSKIDIELKSISMSNNNPTDTLNPATDILTGYIIKI